MGKQLKEERSIRGRMEGKGNGGRGGIEERRIEEETQRKRKRKRKRKKVKRGRRNGQSLAIYRVSEL